VRLAALLLAAVALAGCGGGDDPGDPGEFVEALIVDLARGETGKAWELLHPLHRERVPRALYVRCESDDGFGGKVTKVDVLEVKQERATIPGQFGQHPSTAVTVGITLDTPEAGEPERFTVTAHLFEDEGSWAWVIGVADYAAYMTGVCPSQG
jgi:hypothetical protein